MSTEEDLDLLTAYAARILAASPEEAKSMHFASRIGASQYVAVRDDLRASGAGPRVLDWGAGFGQNAMLLARSGFEVHAFDVRDGYRKYFDLAMRPEEIRFTHGADGAALPYPDGFFDAVLSCGVLEHVPDEARSLREVGRVLRPGGLFFVYHLPNRYSYTEFKNRLTGGYYHERTYTRAQVARLLSRDGFELVRMARFHFLPRIFVERRAALRRLLDPRWRAFNRLDGFFARFPPLSFFATAWQALARRA